MLDIGRLKFDKSGLIPAIIQDVNTRVVLMQGYMDEISVRRSLETGKVCFFSRSRQCLWTKGEESGHFLYLRDILVDCDGDSLLVKVKPEGPTCHTGQDTCWGEENGSDNFLLYLEHFLQKRKNDSPEDSYTAKLISKGINKVAQKVGEEAVELVIEAKDENRELFLNEAADLLYHYLVLLMAKGYELEDVINVLKERHRCNRI
ncbi:MULTISPECIES: bifunctional phosphoribosyl-AMP cyclohydrolase/phosphoribosyl-ATP diphosphatase HisIE [Sanguibacteroides]|uniref:Histidine biosynthesis bifunctional protein HisIE n=1 Tax=Sanguibacteroides justesenii TaxID=1547597 RepID=A0AB34R9W3_9PORP|nr:MULTISPECIES: bifunctional phosphoribosyl-AMP cyclohydrolase/phosphoribosyl-ATP diphosphatase HisIE [Sanguibacteroides]KIO46997.1 phosphoribosyl-ATP pyrophosphatase [Sanguibacteroides justesenii]PXZ43615.1 bifunctional phosphoribosyl-AMP cyclohydrolase/phosphoribosyl-ATP diphosphatase HisIE [Sanguibacteroides justesenii]